MSFDEIAAVIALSFLAAPVALLRQWWEDEGRPVDGPVFAREVRRRGRVVERKHFARGYDAAWANHPTAAYTRLGWKTRAGIAREVRFHDLRHTCASHLAMGTWGRVWRLDEIRDHLGHTDIETTQRYAHLCPGSLVDAAAATQQDPDRTAALLAEARALLEKPGVSAVLAGRAMQDSNLRPSAPEAKGTVTIPMGLPHSRPVEVLFAARAVLSAVADGEPVDAEQLAELAQVVLGQEAVRRAVAILAGDPADPEQLVYGIRLAVAVVEEMGAEGVERRRA